MGKMGKAALKIYYCGMFGALGGICGWFLSEKLFVQLSLTDNIYVLAGYNGAVLGALLGVFISATEGVFSRSVLRVIKQASVGGLLGMIGGSVGLSFGEWIFSLVGSGMVGRALGWAIFGVAVGISDSINSGSQGVKGAFGGVIGGFLGGLVLEKSMPILASPLIGKAVGVTLLGFCIGGAVSLVTTVLMEAWVEVQDGQFAGKTYNLSKYVHSRKKAGAMAVIGSSPWKANIYLPDPKVAATHASIKREAETHVLSEMTRSGGTFVGERKIKTFHILTDTDTIRVGNTKLIYREKRGRRKRP
jgi:hypothetical protein